MEKRKKLVFCDFLLKNIKKPHSLLPLSASAEGLQNLGEELLRLFTPTTAELRPNR